VTTINLYGGPLKRTIIAQAYSLCGQSAAEFELTPEEYDLALSQLNAIMIELKEEWGVDLCYNFPFYGNGLSDEESGIPHGATRSVVRMLAEDVSHTIGKDISSRISYTQARGQLVSAYQKRKGRELGRNTPRGQGNNPLWWGDPFFTQRRHCDAHKTCNCGTDSECPYGECDACKCQS